MHDLNQNQIVLLTLLVSFVTSIATGIMTFTLLQQAPLEVTRTINQVVEKTIQQVTPGTTVFSPGPKEVTTVVVKEDDLILQSIDKNLKSVVRIEEKDVLSGQSSFYGIGLIVNKDGTILAVKNGTTEGESYKATLPGGSEIDLNPVPSEKKSNFILFKPLKADQVKNITFTPVTFADIEPSLGQTVVALGGDTQNAVSVGRVVSFAMKESNTASSTVKYVSSIETDVSTKDLVLGSPLFVLSGNIAGLEISSEGSKSFLAVSLLKKELVNLGQ
jgi:hypothetical protein